jgi:RHS repeat-associated protein
VINVWLGCARRLPSLIRLHEGRFPYNLRFPGQYYQAETGLNQNVNRDYDPLTGKYIESDPTGLDGGINTYTYANANPIALSDMLGLAACGDKKECEDLLRIDTDTCNAITKRRGAAAGAKCHASAVERYAACYRGKPLPPLNTWNNRQSLSPTDLAYWESVTGLSGAALAAYLAISEGSRILFPPRNALPVP